ncbi:MAG: hypothetical protein RL685_1767 [Pseudomonadota bacterium]
MERALREGLLRSRVEGLHIEAELGRGGMGAVLRASDRLLGRSVALKVLGEATEDEQGQLRRFVVEAQLGAQLEHPNIVPFYELLTTSEGRPAFTMKLVEGETLDDYVQECSSSAQRALTPPYDLWSRLDRFLKMCDAIEYAHARGVIHRDIKPGNVMLGTHHEVYVMDWGVARVLDDGPEPSSSRISSSSISSGPVSSGPAALSRTPNSVRDSGVSARSARLIDSPLTQDGEVIGTPAYMAPEQARCEPVTPASDQYALGMVLAELLTLVAPRRGSPRQQLADALLGSPPLLEPRFDGPVPRELLAVVRKATARLPGQRYPGVAELAADVRRFARDEAVSVLPERRWQASWRRIKRRPSLVLGTLGACLLGCCLLAVLGLTQRLRARDQSAIEAAHIYTLSSAVDRTARRIDARFARVEQLLEGLGQAASEILQRPPRAALAGLTPAELGELSLAVFHPRYGQPVSFERSAYVRSPNVSPSEIEPVLGRLDALELLLVRTAARSAAGDEALGYSDAEQRAEARERASVLWTDLAFEQGVLLVYPGNTHFPAGFDTRQRSWYTATTGHWGAVWGSPYPDATSGAPIIACSSAFFGAPGQRGGVAALHMPLEDVLSALELKEVAGFRSAVLLDAQGNVVLSEQTRERRRGAGLHDNQPLERRPFAVEEVRAAVASGAREGRVHSAGALTVFESLDSTGWLLAVTVDGAPYGWD